LPGKRDNKNFILTMNRGQYSELLKVWCKVYEYDGFIHSKCLIVDDKYVLTTSANFDFRSFWSDFEDGILVDSPKFCKEMSEAFNKEISNSKLITKENVKQFNTFANRLRLSFFNLYKPLL
jgi:cardiolipin synthase